MNKRISKKIKKRKLNIPTEYCYTGGFLTPYACPNCKILFKYITAYKLTTCPECSQKLIFKDVFSN